MEQNQSGPSIANDVLQNPDHSKLTQEEIDKAIAHHNKRHHGEQQTNAQSKPEKAKGERTAKPK